MLLYVYDCIYVVYMLCVYCIYNYVNKFEVRSLFSTSHLNVSMSHFYIIILTNIENRYNTQYFARIHILVT